MGILKLMGRFYISCATLCVIGSFGLHLLAEADHLPHIHCLNYLSMLGKRQKPTWKLLQTWLQKCLGLAVGRIAVNKELTDSIKELSSIARSLKKHQPTSYMRVLLQLEVDSGWGGQ